MGRKGFVRTGLVLLGLMLVQWGWAAPFKNLPTRLVQPDGSILDCLASGDEFFNWLHDEEGYTIMQGADGWYRYAQVVNGQLTVTDQIAGRRGSDRRGLKPWALISREEYLSRRDAFLAPLKGAEPAPHTGALNNLVVYIRFQGEDEFTSSRQVFDDRFNPETGYSMKSYYREVSYGRLTIQSSHFPVCGLNTNLSYEDTQVRNYYRPYNATTNPLGYQDDAERTVREHTLLERAIQFIAGQVPAGLEIDGDGDGRVDNVCFVVRGNSDGWNSLLWAHRWALYTRTVSIGGKRVWDYTFQPENQNSVRTLNHEMFHALGAPDLYHYNNQSDTPAGPWDIIHSGGGHMGAWMKYRYANHAWIETIPEITSNGSYTICSLEQSGTNCYRIPSPHSTSEFFVVELRRRTGTFETYLPGTGLLVTRINSAYQGNANGNDEIYIYRPGGTPSSWGDIYGAHYHQDAGRTAIRDTTSPSSFLTAGGPGGLNIHDIVISADGSSATFVVGEAPAETIEVLAPNGGETWRRGENRVITWSASGISGNVTIELLQGETVHVVADSVPATDGSYTWTVGRLANGTWVTGSNTRIRIRKL